MCVVSTNDCLLAGLLYLIYLAIGLFFWHKPTVKQASDRGIEINLLRSRKTLKVAKNDLIDRLEFLKFSNYLSRLDRYRIYRLCVILQLDIKCQEEYKPLEIIRAEIKEKFRSCPKKVIALMALILTGNNY